MKKDTKMAPDAQLPAIGTLLRVDFLLLWGSSTLGSPTSLDLTGHTTTQQWDHKDRHLRDTKPVATTEETCKVAPEARLQRMPRRPPSGNSFHDREAGTRLYIHMCLDKKVTLFRLQGNPGQRAGIQTGHLTVLC